MVTALRRVVLDILKSHEPSLIKLAEEICSIENIEGVNLTSYEIDQKTETIKVTIEGNGFSYESVMALLGEHGVAIHSIDEVAAGKRIVEKVKTPSDRLQY